MDMIERAFTEMYPDNQFKYDAKIKYSGRFSKFNANVRYTTTRIEFGLSKDWRGVDPDIKIGLLQYLMNKVFNTTLMTKNIELYNYFIQNVHIAIPKTLGPEILEDSFSRVNDEYFLGLTEKPNLKWGKHSTRKLGSYDYHGDTITVSRIFQDSDTNMLDYIMFHELLHKMHKFKITKTGRSMHHSTKFKKTEQEFKNADIIDKQLSYYISRWKKINPEKVLKPFKKKFRWF